MDQSDLNHSDVAHFLTTNPNFFEDHAELLGTIRLTSPVLGRAISLQERQMEIMRDKHRQLELRLSDLMHVAQENDNTISKFQKWTNSLLLARNNIDLPRLVTTNLQEFFALPFASLRLWKVSKEFEHAWFACPTSDEVQLFARGLTAPYCGENNDFEAATWIDAPVSSIAMMALRAHGEVVGLLVLGSPDKNRFTKEMSTQFLTQIANTASAALSCLIANPN